MQVISAILITGAFIIATSQVANSAPMMNRSRESSKDPPPSSSDSLGSVMGQIAFSNVGSPSATVKQGVHTSMPEKVSDYEDDFVGNPNYTHSEGNVYPPRKNKKRTAEPQISDSGTGIEVEALFHEQDTATSVASLYKSLRKEKLKREMHEKMFSGIVNTSPGTMGGARKVAGPRDKQFKGGSLKGSADK